ncbi:MAG: ABC transporter substrate-binding protein [Leptolyngbyaceae cyanobacterium]
MYKKNQYLVSKKVKIWQLMVIAIAGCILAISCTTAPITPLRIVSTVWLGYEPLFLARDLGYFADTPIQIIEAAGHAPGIKKFINGDVELSTMTLDIALENAAVQNDIKAFMVLDISDGADALIVRPDIEKISDLKGKRIGLMPATLGKLVLARALETANLTLDDVNIVTLALPLQEKAFQTNEVDALVTFDPMLTNLQMQGAKPLFDSAQMPGEIIDLLVGRADVATTHAQQLKVLLEGWFKALQYMKTNPEDAIARIAEREGMTGEQVARGLSQLFFPSVTENTAIFEQSDISFVEGMKRLAAFLEQQQILTTTINPLSLLDSRPLKSMS